VSQATSIEVRLPKRGAAGSAWGASSHKKPMAEVTVVLEDGARLDIVVPVRAARVLAEDGPALPAEADEVFDRIHALEARTAMAQLTEMLGRRDHSVAEVRDKLRAYGYRPEEIEPTLARACDLRYLDDARFASYFIEERKRRGWGQRKIELELSRKGVPLDTVPGYPERFFSDEEDAARARALLARRRIPDTRPREKLIRFLMGKGFSFALAADAVGEHLRSIEK